VTTVERNFPRRPNPMQGPNTWNDRGIGHSRLIHHTVQIGKVKVPGFKKFSKQESSYSAGSSITVTLHMDKPFDIFAIVQDTKPCVTLDVTTDMTIAGVPIFKNASEFSGVIDTITESYSQNTVTISARSYAQILLNEKVNKTFSSPAGAAKTTTTVVKELVKEFGKGLKVIADDFKTPVGKFFKDRAVKISANVPVWDLLMAFANEDGADLFVKGDTLYYVRKATEKSVDLTELKGIPASLEYVWGKNILDLEIRHSPMFSHDITVTVTSYQPKTGKSYAGTSNMSSAKIAALAEKLEADPGSVAGLVAGSDAKLKRRRTGKITDKVQAASIGNKENYAFFVPGLSQEDCDRLAARIMKDISSKEFVVTLTVLGQPDFTPRQYIKLGGTRSPRTNQVYAIKNFTTESEVPNEGGTSGGYKTTFTLVNHAVQTTGTNLGA
jgi:hypothetical protein